MFTIVGIHKVDFTVNDGSSDERYKLTYETIIHKLLKNNIAVISLVVEQRL